MRPLDVGDIIYSGSCDVQVTFVNPKSETWGWCRTCKSAHCMDARLFESGNGPWKRHNDNNLL